MSFAKGVMIGTIVTAGAIMMYSDEFDESRKKIMKKGRQLMKRVKTTF